MTLLETKIEISKPTGAIIDRSFFDPEPGEVSSQTYAKEGLYACLRELKPDAQDAIIAFSRLETARIEKDMASHFGRKDELEEASYEIADQGTVWRQRTDKISGTIAGRFPNQCLNGWFFNNDNVLFISDAHKLFRINDDLTVWAYSSLTSQAEMNAGIQVATEEMWRELLLQIDLCEAFER
jgi:hypothetical protein